MILPAEVTPMTTAKNDGSGKVTVRKGKPVKSKIEFDIDNNCPECDGLIITDYDRGERHCELCGIVVDDSMLDHGPDYRVYDDKQKSREHVGPPSNNMFHNKGLPTEIDPSMRDSYGRPITGASRRDVYRMQYWNYKSKIKDSRERNIAHANSEIIKLCSHMGLSSVARETAGYLYRKAVDANIIRGRSVVSVIASAIYLSCRMHRQTRSLDEVVEVSDVSRKEIGRVFRFMSREFSIKLNPPRGSEFLERFCERLGLGSDTLRRAKTVMNVCEENNLDLSGKAPMGIVGAVIWLAVDETVDDDDVKCEIQQRIAEVCRITDVTIRNRCMDIKELINKKVT